MTNEIAAKLLEAQAILAEARVKAEAIVADLGPYLEAKAKIAELGLPENCTGEQLSDAMMGTVDLTPPAREILPMLTNSDAAKQIRDAANSLDAEAVAIGTAIGALAGRAVALL